MKTAIDIAGPTDLNIHFSLNCNSVVILTMYLWIYFVVTNKDYHFTKISYLQITDSLGRHKKLIKDNKSGKRLLFDPDPASQKLHNP